MMREIIGKRGEPDNKTTDGVQRILNHLTYDAHVKSPFYMDLGIQELRIIINS